MVAIVLGLALQNTLADVFSGIAVGLERPFHVGDRVSLSGNEGVVVQINWRSIRIQTDSEDQVAIPNSVVAKGQIINRSMPNRRRATSVEITLPAEIPSERVLELMRQAATPSASSSPTARAAQPDQHGPALLQLIRAFFGRHGAKRGCPTGVPPRRTPATATCWWGADEG